MSRPRKKSGLVTSAEFRKECAEAFFTKREVIVGIIDSEKSSASEKLKALDLLAKYGGLQDEDGEIEPRIVIDFGGMSLEERRQFLKELD